MTNWISTTATLCVATFGGVLACGGPVAGVPTSLGGSLRGGTLAAISICASDPVDSTEGCPTKETNSDGKRYRCTGSKLDQYCPGSTTDTGKVCKKKTDNTCDGKQQKYDEDKEMWVDDADTCSKVYYTTATTEAATCTKAVTVE